MSSSRQTAASVASQVTHRCMSILSNARKSLMHNSPSLGILNTCGLRLVLREGCHLSYFLLVYFPAHTCMLRRLIIFSSLPSGFARASTASSAAARSTCYRSISPLRHTAANQPMRQLDYPSDAPTLGHCQENISTQTQHRAPPQAQHPRTTMHSCSGQTYAVAA